MTLAVSRPLLIAAALGSLLAFPAGAGAVGAFPGGGGDEGTDAAALSHGVGERDFDVRAREARSPEPPPPSLGAARADLRRQLGRQGVLELDPVTGTPRIVARLDGFLTGPSAADPADIALGFVRDNLAAFGLDGGDLDTLTLADRRTDGWGITHLSWSQEFRGVPSLDSGLKAAVDEQGRLINLTGSPQPDLAVRETAPDFGAPSALALAQRAGGESVALPPVSDRPGGRERVTEFTDGSDARLVLFAEGSDQLRLAWRVLNVESGTEIYDTVVDASTGETLKRENLVNFAAGAVWEYFPNAEQLITAGSGGDGGGARALKTFPAGWGTSSTALFGNFAHVYSDVNDDASTPSSPDTAGQCGGGAQACGDIPPNQAGPNWNYFFTQNPDGSGIFTDCLDDSPAFPVCTWGDAFTAFDWNYNIAQNGTQVYYYVSKFHDWLAAAPFNFGGAEGFEGADKVNAQIFDGAASDPGNPGTPDEEHLNNANMATLPGADTPPRMQMYLFSGIPLDDLPEVNGGDDASVMYHEYAHGLSNRLVNFTLGQSALNGFQADSMGEGWSDWYALDYLEANNIDEDDREGPPSNTPGTDNDGEMNVGVYPFGGDLHALRTMGLDCAVGTSDIDCDNTANNQAGQGGYTYGDMGKILCNSTATQCQPEVHADGEIWAQAIWDLRQRFRADYVADFNNPHDDGLDRVRAIVTEGMRLSAPNPSFLDMRNAIIQADQALFGGADVGRIWDVFAGRGMGYFAASLGSNDIAPVQNFETPPNCGGGGCTTLSGRVTETESGDAVPNALVEILGPGNLFDQADANGNYSIANVPPHNYPYVAVSAAGYEGELRTNVNVGPGGGTLNLGATRDWAALSGGASVTAFSPPDFGFGCDPAAAFDLSLASGWASTSPNSSEGPGGQKSVTVRLPRKVNITTFAIDPGATCGDDDSASTGGWEILTSETGSGFQRAAQGNFVAGNNHHLNEITPSGNASGIQFVRFVMRNPQIPNTPGSSGADFMDVSEVEVWGRPASGSGPGPGGARCGGRRATKVGTAGRNTITGTNRRDVIAALGGNDRVRGRGGNDLICLGGGRDVANGGGGKDDIRGDAGNDSISGAAGNDKLNGGRGKDTLGGGGGKDTLIGAGGRDTCTGNAGRDVARSCERRRSI